MRAKQSLPSDLALLLMAASAHRGCRPNCKRPRVISALERLRCAMRVAFGLKTP